ncbi:MAG: hypothetical protein N2C13_04675 [Chloroflexota bacterium]
MLAPVTHILALASFRRNRSLPIIGTLLVRSGQKVTATDVIAEAKLEPAHIVLDVARGLGISSKNTSKYMKRRVGDDVTKDSIVASREGLVTRSIRSPHDGRLVANSHGQVLIEIKNKPYQLMAGIPGEMLSVEAELGGIVETKGAWIQGVWGNGKINQGKLKVLATEINHVLSPDEIKPNMRGLILLAGHCNQRSILETAEEASINGLILGSMAPQLVIPASKVGYPIIVIEGFGKLAMNSAAYNLISSHDTRETVINAEIFDRYADKRPEIIIPLDASGEAINPLSMDSFRSGQRVRIIRSPHHGEIGSLITIIAGMTPLPSGLRAQCAQIELESGEKAVIPLANIEVLG